MKRFLLFLALMLSCVVQAFAYDDYDFSKDGLYYYITDPDAKTVAVVQAFEGNVYSGAISIPVKARFMGYDYAVTEIGAGAFSGCTSVSSVVIPNTVTKVGDNAFQNCSAMTTVTIGSGVTSLNENVFSGCSAVSNLIYAEGCTTTVRTYLKSITSVTIPSSVTSIGSDAFYGCSGLTSVTIPEGVKSIGNYAFEFCYGLTSVTIPNSVTSIGNYAFYYCNKLTSVTIPNSVESIGNYAFDLCSGLTSVTIPNSVTSIGNSVFGSCRGLTSITVASGNTKYDSRDNCNGIIETATNTLIAGCKNTTIPGSVTSIGNYAFYFCSGLTTVTIPSSVTSIGNDAFHGCSGLTSITIPNSVKSIGESVLGSCDKLTSIIVEDGNTKYDSRENCNAIIETASNTLIAGCKNTAIPNSVTCIGNDAFERCTGLTSVTIPEGVTSIGNDAFYWCDGLTSITIPNSVTSIGNYAFSSCNKLTSVTNLSPTPQTISSNVFSKYGTLYVPKASRSLYEAADNWKNFTIENYKVTISVQSNDETKGSVSGGGTVDYGTDVTLTATPAEDCEFVRWSDGSTENPYTFTATADVTLTATFMAPANISTKYYTAPQLRAEANNGTALIGILGVTTSGDKYINGAYATRTASTERTLATVTAPQSNEILEVIPTEGGYYLRRHDATGDAGYLACEASGNFTVGNQASATVWAILGPDEEGYGTIANYEALYADIAAEPNEHMIRFIAHNQYLNGQGGIHGSPNPNAKGGLRPGTGAWSFNYAYNANYSELAFADGTDYTATDAQTVGQLTYTRNFKNTNWQALYVPFSLDYEEWCDDFDIARVYNFIDYDDNDDGVFDRTYLVVQKKTSGSTEPNYPYLIRAKETGNKTLTLTDKTLVPAESNSIDCSSVDYIYTFTGSYTPVTDMYANGYYALSGGALNKANSASVVLGAQRWYMELTARGGCYTTRAQSIKIVVDGEDETEGIIAPSSSSKGENPVAYDLMGRGVKGAVKGISIVNGKKIIN